MALLHCPDCRCQISRAALTCPSCGRPNIAGEHTREARIPRSAAALIIVLAVVLLAILW